MAQYTREDILWQKEESKEWIPVKFELQNGTLRLYQQNEFLLALSKTMLGYDSRTVTLNKGGGSLGLSIQGGIEYDKLIQITKIEDDYPASHCSNIHIGDIIVSINGEPTFNKKHDDIAHLIKSSGDRVQLQLITVKDKRENQQNGDRLDLLKMTPEAKWLLIEEFPLAASHLSQFSMKQNRKLTNSFTLELFPSKTLKFHCKERLEKCLDEISKTIIAADKKKVEELHANYSLDDLVCMGWISEYLSSSKHSKVWTKKFLVLRKEEVEIYSQYPTNITEWQSPELSYGVCDITWKILTEQLVAQQLPHASDVVYRPHTMYLQSATGGKHIIAFDSQTRLEYWQRELTNEITDVVQKIHARTFTAKWKKDAVDFTIDLKRGFLIQDTSNMEVLWSKPFVQLQSSTDDGGNKLYLKFQDGEQTIEVTELHSVLCTIEAFLKAIVESRENRSID